MIELSLVWSLILGEVMLVLAVGLASVLFLNAWRRRQDRRAAMQLVATIKAGEGPWVEQTRGWLESAYGLAGDDLDAAAHSLLRSEKLLYQRVINLYIRRDRAALRELNIDVEAVSEAFRNLHPGSAGASAAPVAADDGSGAHLQEENEALKQELQITMETMSRMLGEYAAMFGSGPQGGVAIADLPDEEVEQDLQPLDDELLDLGEDAEVGEPGVEDRTIVLDGVPDGAEVDLFDEAFDSASAAEEQDAGTAAVPEEEMGDELADIWAEALAEQDESDKSK